jgi:hypothetical protein
MPSSLQEARLLSCERVNVSSEHMNPSESFQEYHVDVDIIFLTHGMAYFVTWKNILPCVINEQYFWMINKMDYKAG